MFSFLCLLYNREQKLLLQAEILARNEMKHELQMKEQKKREEKQTTEEMRKMLLREMEESAAAETRCNLQVLTFPSKRFYLNISLQFLVFHH